MRHFYCTRNGHGSIVFGIVAEEFFLFLREHDNSRTAALSLMKFCTTSGSLLNINIIGQRSRFLFVCAWYCLNHLAWIHVMLHRHGPRAVLSLEQGLLVSECPSIHLLNPYQCRCRNDTSCGEQLLQWYRVRRLNVLRKLLLFSCASVVGISHLSFRWKTRLCVVFCVKKWHWLTE